ncbi:hypothetical protein [Streptomyces sp. 900116325]
MDLDRDSGHAGASWVRSVVMGERGPDGGLAWIGRHAYEDHAGQGLAGMRAGISLTAIRGADPASFLLRLGALRDTVDGVVPYRNYRLPDPLPGPPKPAYAASMYAVGMYGTCGEWTFILDDHGAATWFLAQFDNPDALPGKDEELVCVTLNRHHAPSMIVYSPQGAEGAWTAEFGTGLLEYRLDAPDDPSGALAAFDQALAGAGAIHSQLATGRSWSEWPPAVYQAVADRFGISVNRHQAEQGLLPAVALPLP